MSKLNEVLGTLGLEEEKANAILEAFESDTKGLKENKDKILGEFSELKSIVKGITDKNGIDKNDLQTYFDKKDQEAKLAEQLKSQLENATTEFEKRFNDAISKKDAEIQSLVQEKKDSLLNREIRNAISEKGITGAKAKALESLLKQDASIVDESGKFNVKFNGENGLIESKDYFESFWANDGKEFLPSGNLGGNASGSVNSGNANYSQAKSAQEKLDIIKNKLSR